MEKSLSGLAFFKSNRGLGCSASVLLGPDGYTYKTVKIGNQEWLAENLRTTVYANGDPISYSRTQDSWATLDMGMRCSYRHED